MCLFVCDRRTSGPKDRTPGLPGSDKKLITMIKVPRSVNTASKYNHCQLLDTQGQKLFNETIDDEDNDNGLL